MATKKATKTVKKAVKKAATKKAAPAPKKKAVAKKPAAKKPAAKKAKTKRKPNAAFMKPMKPSSTLAAIIGDKAVPRTEAVKQLWAYIKKHNLQDKKNRRMINTDQNLRALFGEKQVSMFDVAKVLNKNLK